MFMLTEVGLYYSSMSYIHICHRHIYNTDARSLKLKSYMASGIYIAHRFNARLQTSMYSRQHFPTFCHGMISNGLLLGATSIIAVEHKIHTWWPTTIHASYY